MAPQILGVIISTVGLFWFLSAWIRGLCTADEAGRMMPEPGWGIIVFVGGLILWGLGRIETTLAPSPHHRAQGKVLCGILSAVIAAAVLVILWQFKLGRL